MEDVINSLLKELEDELQKTKKGFFTERSTIDADACLDLIDEIRGSLPTELDRANNIMNERRQILIDAEEEAKQCIAAAQKTAEEMIAEDEITHRAEIEAKKIIDTARQNARETKLAALNYARGVFDELKESLKDLEDQVEEDTAAFNK